jgi:ubiquinone/menaquinone biosynthesis C-methylase UbiE
VDAPPLTPLAAAVLHVPPPERALVVGAGDGEPAFFLTREFPAARVRAVERSPERLREAQAKVGLDPEGRLAFKRAGPGALPYPDDFFDLVAQVSGRVSPREVARVLRSGGYFVHAPASTPRFAVGWREGVLRSRLERGGFVLRRTESAGHGKFLVARLDRDR